MNERVGLGWVDIGSDQNQVGLNFVKPGKSVLFIYLFFFSSENEQIGNSCRDGINKTLDFSLDLR